MVWREYVSRTQQFRFGCCLICWGAGHLGVTGSSYGASRCPGALLLIGSPAEAVVILRDIKRGRHLVLMDLDYAWVVSVFAGAARFRRWVFYRAIF